MKETKISTFMLERFRLGELNPGDALTIRQALIKDKTLHSTLEALDESDQELRLKYPYKTLGLPDQGLNHPAPRHRIRRMAFIIAAAVIICILFPVTYFLRFIPETQEPTDRAKGLAPPVELALYLKGGQETPLQEQTALHEGSTVQLAYTAPVGEHYGVIFSIDGRSEVTLHYPYRRGQSALLVPGRKTLLNEAYTLDDAPGFELFVMVVSPEPLNPEAVLSEARRQAETGNTGKTGICIEERMRAAFQGCEIQTLRMLKQ